MGTTIVLESGKIGQLGGGVLNELDDEFSMSALLFIAIITTNNIKKTTASVTKMFLLIRVHQLTYGSSKLLI